MQTITIDTDFIKLESAIKLAGWFETGGQAKIRIQLGDVLYNGKQCLQRGRKCKAGDVITMGSKQLRIEQAPPEE